MRRVLHGRARDAFGCVTALRRAYVAPSTRTTGTLITAAIWNSDVVNNPIALYAGAKGIASQAALDFLYAESATQEGRLAKGTQLQVPRLNVGASAYEFGGLLGFPCFVWSTTFETLARFLSVVVNGGLLTFGTSGAFLNTSASAASSALVRCIVPASASAAGSGLFGLSPIVFGCSIEIVQVGTDAQSFFGFALPTVAGAGITFTDVHVGFKIVRAASGANNLFATVANGTTETASSSLTTLAVDDDLEVAFRMNSTANVEFWFRKNGGTWSSVTVITTNIPTTVVRSVTFAISNASVASQTRLAVCSAFVSA